MLWAIYPTISYFVSERYRGVLVCTRERAPESKHNACHSRLKVQRFRYDNRYFVTVPSATRSLCQRAPTDVRHAPRRVGVIAAAEDESSLVERAVRRRAPGAPASSGASDRYGLRCVTFQTTPDNDASHVRQRRSSRAQPTRATSRARRLAHERIADVAGETRRGERGNRRVARVAHVEKTAVFVQIW